MKPYLLKLNCPNIVSCNDIIFQSIEKETLSDEDALEIMDFVNCYEVIYNNYFNLKQETKDILLKSGKLRLTLLHKTLGELNDDD